MHAKTQRSRHDGWFEVIVGKSVVDDDHGKCFAYVQTYDRKPKRRLFELLKSHGVQEHRTVRFLTDGGDDVRAMPEFLSAESEHLLDYLHLTMRLTVMRQLTKSLPGEQVDTPEQGEDEVLEGIEPTVVGDDSVNPREQACRRLDRVKWLVWHGNVGAR